MRKINRRFFLERTSLASAAMLLGGGALAGCDDTPVEKEPPTPAVDIGAATPTSIVAPSDRVRLAMLGMRGYGMKLSAAFSKVPGVHISHVCDVDTAVGKTGVDHVEELTGKKPVFVQDLRKLFEDRSIDAVALSIPHHWHALAAVWAMQAGKHVYLEKPVTHNVREGRSLLAAMKKYGRVVQSGTQLRSNTSMAAAARCIKEGKLGAVNVAYCMACKRRKSIGPLGQHTPPYSVNYDLWSGPAPVLPVNRERFHYDWHWLWEYGNGGLGNNGVHRVDLARWGMGLTGLGDSVMSYGGRFGYTDAGVTPNTQITIHQFGDKTVVQDLRGLPTRGFKSCKNGVMFFGDGAYIRYDGGTAKLMDEKNVLVKEFEREPQEESHQANFIRAIREDNPSSLNGGLLEGVQSAALCHVGSISHRVGRPASDSEIMATLEGMSTADDLAFTFARLRSHMGGNKIHQRLTLGPLLELDSEKETVLDHPDADALMRREYREPFVLPAPEDV